MGNDMCKHDNHVTTPVHEVILANERGDISTSTPQLAFGTQSGATTIFGSSTCTKSLEDRGSIGNGSEMRGSELTLADDKEVNGQRHSFKDGSEGVEVPDIEAIRSFYEATVVITGAAIDSGDWGNLHYQHLASMAESLGFADLGEEESKRIFDTMKKDAEGAVGLDQFIDAVTNGPKCLVLRSMINKLRMGRDFGFKTPPGYDYSKTTTENYAVQHKTFVGEFADIRETRDYSYHANYAEERQMWQDNTVRSIMNHAKHMPAPWLVYTCGPMGAGKGFCLSWMSRRGIFPIETLVHIDPDGFKMMMPEWTGYVAQDSDSAGSKCHKESAFMMEIAQAAAMKQQLTVWVDGSLRDAEFYSVEFQEIRNAFPQYRIAIFYVDASEAIVRERCKIRAQKTGRNVPEELIVGSLNAMDHALNKLTPFADFVARINNDGTEPRLIACESLDHSGMWGVIKDHFAKPVADVCRFPHALPPMMLTSCWDPEHFAAVRKTRLLESGRGSAAWSRFRTLASGSTSISPSRATISDKRFFDVVKLLFRETDIPLHRKLLNRLPKDFEGLNMSPAKPVTLPDFQRKMARIPLEAVSFFWMYSAVASRRGQPLHWKKLAQSGDFSKEEMLDPVVRVLQFGGFCYLNAGEEVCGVTTISHKTEIFALQFTEPQELSPSEAAAVPENVLKPVTATYLTSRGAVKYAWFGPNEMHQRHNIGCAHGAFVYQMKADDRRKLIRFPVM
mmetsp:Transcript_10455/g.23492  ORF Transcript_10455/g.23492 Transcript_10455/m.23492 type:complete len:731 (+) Transcript_10455:46-2238(+)